MQSFDRKNEGQDQGVEERDLHHSTENIQFHIGEFFQYLATWEHTFMQSGYAHTDTYTHIQTHTHSKRQG